ncbi:HAMP domain-containing sensor histidine kinase [Jatrophihabitans sp.]|uniref:sensor histidine kinase n=1 Tax=Jatrophihabitans sp. TaxID=1932789 RepID=UPI0030C6B7BF|nr:Signal transduction histidine kinase [Jatrophihabitans sp.]
MRLTARRRAVIAVLVSWPLGFFYLYWAWYIVINIGRELRGGYSSCSGDWRDVSSACGSAYDIPLVLAELLVVTSMVVLAAWGLGRWVTWPVRSMGLTIEQLGPTNLGTRIRAAGPRDETRQLADAIDAMLDRVAEGYEAQRRFAANASHELRTPLATQRALIEVSLGSALTPDQLDLLSRQLLATNQRNESLIEGLLVLAETERGLMSNTNQQLDRLVVEVLAPLRAGADEQGIAITADLAEVQVNGEGPLLERLVSNLVGNAIKYNQRGGWVQVVVRAPGTLQVSNSGPVVPPELVNGLFEPFRRLSGDRLDHGGGVGLGLTIARSVVAAHHGSITASANPAGGLTIEVRLP